MKLKTGLAILVGMLVGCGGGGQMDAHAQKYDVAKECWGAFEVVGSLPADTSCDSALQVASKNGACFLFPSTCVPAGFRALSSNDTTCPQVTAPQCSS